MKRFLIFVGIVAILYSAYAFSPYASKSIVRVTTLYYSVGKLTFIVKYSDSTTAVIGPTIQTNSSIFNVQTKTLTLYFIDGTTQTIK